MFWLLLFQVFAGAFCTGLSGYYFAEGDSISAGFFLFLGTFNAMYALISAIWWKRG